MIVYHYPNLNNLPSAGGVRQHIAHLLPALERQGIRFTDWVPEADVVHVQTSYRASTPDVWTCHGGFVPPILEVAQNLREAKTVISVAQWVVDEYFPPRDEVYVIPNGVDVKEFENLPFSGLEPGYILWSKAFLRPDWDMFYRLAEANPDLRFVSTLFDPCRPTLPVGLGGVPILPNLQVIGIQTYEAMKSVMNDCSIYVSTGSEVCPIQVLEAWACRKPVLAWEGDGNAELLRPGSFAIMGGWMYVDFDEMVYGLSALLEDPEFYGSAGRTRVEHAYAWDDIARRTVEVYHRSCALL